MGKELQVFVSLLVPPFLELVVRSSRHTSLYKSNTKRMYGVGISGRWIYVRSDLLSECEESECDPEEEDEGLSLSSKLYLETGKSAHQV